MDLLADTWVLWIILTIVCVGLVWFSRQNKNIDTSFVSSADEFSIKTVLLGFKKGEGDLFLGYIGAIIFFSLFLAGFTRWITTIFG